MSSSSGLVRQVADGDGWRCRHHQVAAGGSLRSERHGRSPGRRRAGQQGVRALTAPGSTHPQPVDHLGAHPNIALIPSPKRHRLPAPRTVRTGRHHLTARRDIPVDIELGWPYDRHRHTALPGPFRRATNSSDREGACRVSSQVLPILTTAAAVQTWPPPPSRSSTTPAESAVYVRTKTCPSQMSRA